MISKQNKTKQNKTKNKNKNKNKKPGKLNTIMQKEVADRKGLQASTTGNFYQIWDFFFFSFGNLPAS